MNDRPAGGTQEPPIRAARAQLDPTLVWPLRSIVEPIDLKQLFARAQPLEVELGSGDGSFITQYAQVRPDRNFLAVERLLGRLRKIDRKGLRAGLTNLRLVRIEASYLIEYLLPPASVAALHVYFPDPWPKRKHRHHRLINARFVALTRRVLAPTGTVYLRTDDGDYFDQMTAVFGADQSFVAMETPEELASLRTDFERDFLAKGVATRRATYRLG